MVWFGIEVLLAELMDGGWGLGYGALRLQVFLQDHRTIG